MIPDPPPGQGPIDPRGAFSPPGSVPPGAVPPSSISPGAVPPGAVPSGNPPPINLPPGFSRGFPSMPPPPQYPQYPQFMMQPPRPRGGFVRGIFFTLATSIFGFSILLNIYLLIAIGLTGNGSAQETTLVKGEA